MLEEIVHIRNFIFSEKIQLMAIREGERTRDTANVKSCRDICGLYRVLYIFFLLRLKLVKQCRFCVLYHRILFAPMSFMNTQIFHRENFVS